MSPEDANRELDAAAKTGARWLRVHIDWHFIEPVKEGSTGATPTAGSTVRETGA